jgi:hypothetical protein
MLHSEVMMQSQRRFGQTTPLLSGGTDRVDFETTDKFLIDVM